MLKRRNINSLQRRRNRIHSIHGVSRSAVVALAIVALSVVALAIVALEGPIRNDLASIWNDRSCPRRVSAELLRKVGVGGIMTQDWGNYDTLWRDL